MSRAASRHPNLLLVITDQQRADTVTADGPCLTPNLQSLAAQGATFERCYSPNPICSPTRASLFTGLLPHSHHVEDVTHAAPPPKSELAADVPFWPRLLQEAGYRTGYFGKWHVERSERLERFGFDEYETELNLVGVPTTRRSLRSERYVSQPGYRDFLLYGVSNDPPETTREHQLFGRGIRFIESAGAERERPWALVIAAEAPHDPYVATAEHRSRYDAATLALPVSRYDDLAERPAIYRRMQRVWQDLSDDDAREAMACYYANCSLIDDQMGRIVAALERTGQLDNTLIVFTSDHGDLLGAHGLWLKGVPAFEETYRVPLLLAGPGITPGASCQRAVSLVDLGATLTTLLLGRDFPGHGRDLTPLLAGEGSWSVKPTARTETAGETPPAGDDNTNRPIAADAYAEFHGQRFAFTQRVVWHGRHKLVFNAFAEDELYDLDADPFELRNLAAYPEHGETLRRLTNLMWRVAHDTGDDTFTESHYGTLRFAAVGPELPDEPPP